MLRNVKLMWVVLSLLVIGGAASAVEDVSVDVSIDYVGKYIWRGLMVTDDPVLQPAVSVGTDKLTLSIWGNSELTNINGERGEFTEVDYTLDYTDALPGLEDATFSAGAIYYRFPRALNTTGTTTELYAGIGLDNILSPTATLYYDFDEADGFYASFGVSHAVDITCMDITDGMVKALDLSATLGYGDSNYNSEYWAESTDSMNDLVITAAIPVELCQAASLITSCSYVSLLDGSIKNGTAGQKGDYLYAGVGLAVSF